MLKKLNGNITKLLFYIKNNLVSCVFKFSVLSTMLILVYLVCILSQTDSVSSSDNSDVYPMEISQKLMLAIPPEVSIGFQSDTSPYSTTELLTTDIENSILRTHEVYIGTHPYFPIQEPTTTPIPAFDQTTPYMHQQIVESEATTVITHIPEISTEENTIPTSSELITRETNLLSTSTDVTTEETVVYSTQAQEITSLNTLTPSSEPDIFTTAIPSLSIPSIPTIPVVPFKRSLSLEELKMFESTSKASTTEAPMDITTISTMDLLEKSKEEIEDLSTNLLTSSSYPDDDKDVQHSTSTASAINTPLTNSDDNLFMDNWGNYLTANNENIQSNSVEQSSSHLNFLEDNTENFFEHEESTFASNQPTVLKSELGEPLEEKPASNTEHSTEHEHFLKDTSHITEHYIEEPYRIFSPQNLLNLFSFDHQPSPSNARTIWWPKPKSLSMSVLTDNAAKNHIKRTNEMLDDSEEGGGNQRFKQVHQLRRIDSLLNTRLKNSVSIFEKLFGNFLQ